MSRSFKTDRRARSLPTVATMVALCVALLGAIWLIYGQTIHQGFVNVDDGVYIYRNARIMHGMAPGGLGWFFVDAYCDYWAPLLALSQIADWQCYGWWPGGHHLTNGLLFASSVLLLFFLLERLTGALWRSAFVAAAWAVHPLRVESVAWITERKDTLSGLFFLLTLTAYVHYVRQPRSLRRYLTVALLFALGLMCKPSLVTLPFILLLLDYWPLGRADIIANWQRLVLEKAPLFLLSAGSCIITYATGSATLVSVQKAPVATRAANALLSYVIYLGQTFYPKDLAAFYPYPTHPLALWETAWALTLLVCLTGVAVAWRRAQPWLLVGWLWYLGMLVPMSGIVQAGEQAHADRDTYLPQIGLLLAITWTAWSWFQARRLGRFALGAAAVAALTALLVSAHRQASYWRDSATLWRHTIACTAANSFAQTNLGVALLDQGKPAEAAVHLQAAVAIDPNQVQAQYDLGNLLLRAGHPEAAIDRYERALATQPNDFDALNNLGIALASARRNKEAVLAYRRALVLRPAAAEVHGNLGHTLLATGDTTAAISQFQQAVQLAPADANGYDGLGGALLLANRPAEAAASYQRALDLRPDDEAAHGGLASAYLLQGRVAEAVADWRRALALNPRKVSTLNNLAWVLATGPAALRDGAEAVQMARSALQLAGSGSPVILQTLAAAYAESGRFPEAWETAHTALALAVAQSNRPLAAKIEQELRQYETGLPFREAPAASAPAETNP